ncbi:MAG: ABC transporter ATP-binding protein [Dermatophilaceae bacterium]|nr:ABC transporter ATP-binding protein [Dermatophilaceae bacterium]
MPLRLPSPSRSERPPALPPLWSGRRRVQLSLLALTGLGQATIAGLGAHVLIRLLGGPSARPAALLVGLMAAAALCVGGLRMAERVIAERVSQGYVHELRLGLVERTLERGSTNLGVTVARTTNDLSAVRTWIFQGVVPLAVGVPFLLGATAALFLIDPMLALTLVVPLGALGLAMRRLVPVAYQRSRHLRRIRGRLAGHVTDTVMAAPGIRPAGGQERELRRVERLSRQLGQAAISRARTGGALRGVAAATSGLASASAIAVGLATHLPTAEIAAALTINGLLSTPIHDLGRVAEFRQTYLAARHVIAPVLQPGPVRRHGCPGTEDGAGTSETASATAAVVISGFDVGAVSLPRLEAAPGDRVLLRTGSSALDSEILHRLVSSPELAPGQVSVNGVDLATASPRDTRHVLGFAARGMMLTRSSVARTVAYRVSGTPGEDVTDTLRRVGLHDAVEMLPDGAQTILRRGGQPLTRHQRALLALARSIYRNPALLVLDHVDADLGREGRDVLLEVLRSHPGVVVIATDLPGESWTPTHRWSPTVPSQEPCVAELFAAGAT